MWKNRIFASINILGLGIGLALCIVAYLNWQYNAEFDHYHENTDLVFRFNFITKMDNRSLKNGSCPLPLAKAAKQNISQIVEVARYLPTTSNFKVEDQIFRTGMCAVDPSFMDLFTFQLLAGDPGSLGDIVPFGSMTN